MVQFQPQVTFALNLMVGKHRWRWSTGIRALELVRSDHQLDQKRNECKRNFLRNVFVFREFNVYRCSKT